MNLQQVISFIKSDGDYKVSLEDKTVTCCYCGKEIWKAVDGEKFNAVNRLTAAQTADCCEFRSSLNWYAMRGEI